MRSAVFRKIITWLASMLAKRKKVLVHCRFGIGRTGTLITAWLLKQGQSLDQALEMLRHTPAEPKSDAQWLFLHAYALSINNSSVSKTTPKRRNRSRLGLFFRKHARLLDWGDDAPMTPRQDTD